MKRNVGNIMFAGVPSVHAEITLDAGRESRKAKVLAPFPAQIAVEHGQLFGRMCEVALEAPLNNTARVLGYLDVGSIPHEVDSEALNLWIMRATIAAAVRVLAGEQRPNELGFVQLPVPTNVNSDPQFASRSDLRKQCRTDVLAVIAARVNSDDRSHRESIELGDVTSSGILTRLYDEAEIVDAMHYWNRAGFLVDAAFGHSFRIDVDRDQDIERTLSEMRPTVRTLGDIRSGQQVVSAAETLMISAAPNETAPTIDVFISHSSDDVHIAQALVDLLRNALPISPERILCTSVEGHKLDAGANVAETIRLAVRESKAFIALISESSLKSHYVLFELGARWGADRHLAPLLAAGATAELLTGPLRLIHAISIASTADVHQFLGSIGKVLGAKPNVPATYQRFLDNLASANKPRL